MSLETLNQGATDWDKFAPPVEDVRRKQESVDNTPEPSPIYKNIDGGAIEGGGVEENVKAATEELRARREANAGPVVDDPILEWSGSAFRENGAHESPANQVKRASEGMTNWRKTQLGQQYLKGWGVEKTDAEAFAIADNAAALGRKPSQDPISKTLPVDDQGNVIQPLDD